MINPSVMEQPGDTTSPEPSHYARAVPAGRHCVCRYSRVHPLHVADAGSCILVAASAWPRRCYGHSPPFPTSSCSFVPASIILERCSPSHPTSSHPPPHPLRHHPAISYVCGCVDGRRWGHGQLNPLQLKAELPRAVLGTETCSLVQRFFNQGVGPWVVHGQDTPTASNLHWGVSKLKNRSMG